LRFDIYIEFIPGENPRSNIFSKKVENFQIQNFFLGKNLEIFPEFFLEILGYMGKKRKWVVGQKKKICANMGLNLEEVRSYEGLENLSDEEIIEIVDFLRQIAELELILKEVNRF
jgi:hypothetical protein